MWIGCEEGVQDLKTSQSNKALRMVEWYIVCFPAVVVVMLGWKRDVPSHGVLSCICLAPRLAVVAA